MNAGWGKGAGKVVIDKEGEVSTGRGEISEHLSAARRRVGIEEMRGEGRRKRGGEVAIL